MSEQEQNNIDTAIREKEIAFKEREIALREQEAQAKIELDKRGIWFSSPLLIGIFSAIFGLLGTGIGAALQGYSSLQLERQKFESSLMQKALEIKDRNEAAKTLLFLVDSGVIQSLDGERIRKIAENPEQLPSLTQLLVATGRGGAIASSPDGKPFLLEMQMAVLLFGVLTAKYSQDFHGIQMLLQVLFIHQITNVSLLAVWIKMLIFGIYLLENN